MTLKRRAEGNQDIDGQGEEMNKFSSLERALQNKTRFYDIITANELNEEYLEGLFHELFENSCEGIESKVAEARRDLLGFLSLLSELEFARYFIRRKMKVKLLSCNDFEGRSPPDIWVHDDSKEFWVEVKNISEDRTIFFLGRKIASILNSQGLSFAITIGSSSLMSISTYFYNTRKEKEGLIMPILKEFTEKIKDISSRSLPTTIEISSIDVNLYKTKFKKSYMGGTRTVEAICEPKDYRKRIRLDVLEKAKKRNKWLGEELNKPYIVAIDSEPMLFNIDHFNEELYGHATIYVEGKIPETGTNQEIEEAVNNGWKEYLEKMRILRVNGIVIPKDERGLFFTDPTTKNVSAVLLMRQQTFHILANPFADSRINNPTILQDFADCFSGWKWLS
jgi:hypothetical protein